MLCSEMSCWSDSLIGISTSLLSVPMKTRQVKLHKALPIILFHCCCSYINSGLELTLQTFNSSCDPRARKEYLQCFLCLLESCNSSHLISVLVMLWSIILIFRNAYSKELWSPLLLVLRLYTLFPPLGFHDQ